MLNYDTVINWDFGEISKSYDERDTILYALGLGYGQDPLSEAELRYVYEKGLQAVPTMAVVLGSPGAWMADPRTGIDWVKSLHGEQGLRIFRPLPVAGTAIGRNRVVDVIDKGAGRGALLYLERDIVDAASGELIATRTSTSFLRGDGGCGAPAKPQPEVHPIPTRAPDIVHDIATRPETALIYRLSGDYNPVHADPKVAARAGFDRPILHGLCTFGIAARALIATVCRQDATRLRLIDGRFSRPVFPGETIRTEIWVEGEGTASFRVQVPERETTVFNNGRAAFD